MRRKRVARKVRTVAVRRAAPVREGGAYLAVAGVSTWLRISSAMRIVRS